MAELWPDGRMHRLQHKGQDAAHRGRTPSVPAVLFLIDTFINEEIN